MRAATRYSIALVVGVVAFLFLFPFAGSDTQPPTQWSVFGNRVPSAEPYLAAGAGLAAAVLVLVVTRLVERQRGPRRRVRTRPRSPVTNSPGSGGC